MRRLRRQLGFSAVRYMSTAMTLPLSHGGGEPPPTPSSMATCPPPEPPPESPGQIFNLQICATITTAQPPSTTIRSPSSTLSALHLPRLPHFPSTRCTPPESPLLTQHQGLRFELTSLLFHSRSSNPPSTINVCGAGENKHDLWAGNCDVRAPTLLTRPKKVLAEGDVHINLICSALSVIEIEPLRVVAAELKEERSLFSMFNYFIGLSYALMLGCLKWKLSLAKDGVSK